MLTSPQKTPHSPPFKFMSVSVKDTLNLPKTSFPMKGNLPLREPLRIAHWQKINLYEQIQKKNAKGAPFILHDGPPFTNGEVHIGTALNKCLKEIILRYKTMRGYRTPYIPGWDCHGLPIEHKVAKKLQEENKKQTPETLRHACAAFSQNYIETLREQFIRLGVLADWKREYKTMDPGYEATVLRTFARFVEKGLVYRSKKPIYWSIPCKTALAEAEIEYKDHVSPSIWVKFPFTDAAKIGLTTPTHLIIWTTTPWTLPANLAIAAHPKLSYVPIHYNDETYIVAEKLAEHFIKECELKKAQKGTAFPGHSLENLKAHHPFIDRPSLLILGDHVTTDVGTGLVHTAPGHGVEDYHIALQYKLDIYSPVDDQGCFTTEVPTRLQGLSIAKEANEEVIQILKEKNLLLKNTPYTHSYPHCWRSKTPVIFRAMDQWFISLNENNLQKKALENIEQVQWIPASGKNRIKAAIETRPDWCISRQRTWGVPIPVFYDQKTKEPLLDIALILAVADKVEKRGVSFWFEEDTKTLIKELPLPKSWENRSLDKGLDILDVWIESGSSHRAVLQKEPTLHWPADLYLEGSDQHRGWFQSSLWTGIIADEGLPYRRVITHGFVKDENRKKISKSSEKPQNMEPFVKKYGADILRLWVSSQDYQNDILLSSEILTQVVGTYRSIRNTLMYQLGNLYDFDFIKNAVDFSELHPLDQWALQKTATLVEEVTEAFDSFEIHKTYQLFDRFCGVVLSRTYHDILKDRLYTYAPHWKERRSAQTAIFFIFHTLIRLLSPILPFTTDEAFGHELREGEFSSHSIHVTDWPKKHKERFDPQVCKEIDLLIEFRQRVNEKLEKLRQEKIIGKSLEAHVLLRGSPEETTFALLQKYREHLAELFIVSQVTLVIESSAASVFIDAVRMSGVRCPRCWRWVPELVSTVNYGKVSPRCREALLQTNHFS